MTIAFTNEQEQAICRRYEVGENTDQLGAAFGVSRHTVTRILKRKGIKRRSISEVRGGISPEVEIEVCRRYQNGESAVAIAAGIGFNKSSILRCLKRNGISRRSNSEAHGGLDKTLEPLACSYYLSGLSCKEIGAKLGVSQTTIGKVLAHNGVALRPPKVTSLKLTAAQIQQILYLYEDGMPVTEVAKTVGCGEWSAWNQLKVAGVEIRGARGGDTTQQAIDGTNRFALKKECSFYVSELARYRETHCKPGIAWDVSIRAGVSRGEYGDSVLRIIFATRREAYFLEQASLYRTKHLWGCPDDLEAWQGATEIRAIAASEFAPIALQLADEMQELGPWEFAVRFVPLTSTQRAVCEAKARETGLPPLTAEQRAFVRKEAMATPPRRGQR